MGPVGLKSSVVPVWLGNSEPKEGTENNNKSNATYKHSLYIHHTHTRQSIFIFRHVLVVLGEKWSSHIQFYIYTVDTLHILQFPRSVGNTAILKVLLSKPAEHFRYVPVLFTIIICLSSSCSPSTFHRHQSRCVTLWVGSDSGGLGKRTESHVFGICTVWSMKKLNY